MCFDNRQLVKGAEYRFHSEEMVEEGKKKKKNCSQKSQPNEAEEFGRSQVLVVHLHSDTAGCATAY